MFRGHHLRLSELIYTLSFLLTLVNVKNSQQIIRKEPRGESELLSGLCGLVVGQVLNVGGIER